MDVSCVQIVYGLVMCLMTKPLAGHVLYSQDHMQLGHVTSQGQGGHVMDHVISSHGHMFLKLLDWSWD